MNILTAYTAQGYLGANALLSLNNENATRETSSESMPTGDTVEISDDALAMLSRAVENNDTAGDRSAEDSDQGEYSLTDASASGSAATDTTAVEDEIESLQGQLAALLNQLASGPSTTVHGKIASIQAKIAALQAQLV